MKLIPVLTAPGKRSLYFRFRGTGELEMKSFAFFSE